MRRDGRAIERFAGRVAVIAIDLLVGHKRWVVRARAVLARPDLSLAARALLALDGLALARLSGGIERLLDVMVSSRGIAQGLPLAVGIDVAPAWPRGVAKVVGVRAAAVAGLVALAALSRLAVLSRLARLP